MDIVAEGYDAGVRRGEAIERDMVHVRLTDSFRFVVVGAPEYFARQGTPQRPEDLLRHECITFRSQTTGALNAVWLLALSGCNSSSVGGDEDGRLRLSASRTPFRPEGRPECGLGLERGSRRFRRHRDIAHDHDLFNLAEACDVHAK